MSELEEILTQLRARASYLETLTALGIPKSAVVPVARSPAVAPSDRRGEGGDVVPESDPAKPEELAAIREELGDCQRCGLAGGRKTIVFGQGDPAARLMFIGEAPGAAEDAQGLAFVGRAGQLLTRMIEAIDFSRDDVFIANIIKCRPPGNRNPEPDEISACQPFLEKQIDAIRPDVIVALGKFAGQWLLQTADPISRIRGHFGEYRGVRVMPTYHPAYLLRNPSAKRMVWEDLQIVRDTLRVDN